MANKMLGLPRSILMVMLNDKDTGAPLCLMSANLLSAMRTGAMPAMAASYLARKDSKALSLIGPGVINKCAFQCYMEVLPEIDTLKNQGKFCAFKICITYEKSLRKRTILRLKISLSVIL